MFNGDYMWGSIYAGLGVMPVSWFGYFNANVDVNRNISNPGGVNWATFNVSLTSSFMASTFISIVERDATGADVLEIPLGSLGWNFNTSESDLITNKTAGLYGFVFDGSRIIQGWPTVQLQYIITEVGGELSLLNGVFVFPRAIESLILIDDWRYQNTANSLVLKVAVGTVQGSWVADGQITGGSGDGKVYFLFSKDVSVNGTMQPAKIGAIVTVDATVAFSNPNVAAQLNTKYQKEASCQVIEVILPAGANKIIYDPTMGSGEFPYGSPPTTDSNVVAIVLGIVGSLVVVVIVVVLIVMFGKRPTYTAVE